MEEVGNNENNSIPESTSTNFNQSENVLPKSNKKIWLFASVAIFIVVVLTASFVIFNFANKESSELKSYNSNFESFLSQAKSCEPSKVLYNVSLDILGLRTDTYTYEISLRGIKNNSCDFYMEIVNYTADPVQDGLPPLEFFKMLNKSCNIPLEMIETEFNYWKSGSPNAFSNKSYCTYTEQGSMTVDNDNNNQPSCTENWDCTSWSDCSNNQQTRNCNDLSNCGTENGKPITKTYCTLSACTVELAKNRTEEILASMKSDNYTNYYELTAQTENQYLEYKGFLEKYEIDSMKIMEGISRVGNYENSLGYMLYYYGIRYCTNNNGQHYQITMPIKEEDCSFDYTVASNPQKIDSCFS